MGHIYMLSSIEVVGKLLLRLNTSHADMDKKTKVKYDDIPRNYPLIFIVQEDNITLRKINKNFIMLSMHQDEYEPSESSFDILEVKKDNKKCTLLSGIRETMHM